MTATTGGTGSWTPLRRRKVLAVIAALASTLSACDISAYAFRVDESIEITHPPERSVVELPVTIRWTDDTPPENLRVAPNDPTAEYYGVFVDRSPLGPGRHLSSLADDPEVCEQDPDCPDEVLLRDKGVFLTAEREVTLEFLPDLRPSARAGAKDPHEVVIVRMRGDTRVGEAAFIHSFFVQR